MSDAAAPGHDAPPDGDTMPSDLNTSNTTAAFEPTNQGAAGTAGSPAATHAATEPNALLLGALLLEPEAQHDEQAHVMQPELDHQLDVEESEQGAQLLDAELLQLERSNQAEINANERRELEAREERARLERRGADIKQRLEHNQRIAALDQRQRRERHFLAPHSQAGIAARRDAADLGQLSSDMAELRAFRERDTNQRELEHQRHAPYGQQQQPSLPPIAAHTEQSPYTTGLPDYRTTGLPDYRTAAAIATGAAIAPAAIARPLRCAGTGPQPAAEPSGL
jgi:hypothetical protein